MRKSTIIVTAFVISLFSIAPVWASNPMVGGHAMSPQRNIVQNALNSSDHTLLVKAVKQAGLVKALEGHGPYTVFAPTNAAFRQLPHSTLKRLMQKRNRAKLKDILLYHVVKGDFTFSRLRHKICAGGGKARLKTLNGHDLTVEMNGAHNIIIKDARGDVAHISIYNVRQSNSLIQVIDRALLPPRSGAMQNRNAGQIGGRGGSGT